MSKPPNATPLFIITGGSRGLGKSLALMALKLGATVITLSRTKILLEGRHIGVTCDLSRPKAAIQRLERVLKKQKLKSFSEIHLIHNAALLEPICQITKAKVIDIENHMNVNLLAPLLLSRFFVQATKAAKVDKSITFISSGAANFAIPNWTMYCTTKAGLKMLAESLAIEKLDDHLRVFSYSPGLMDTNMQKQIRGKKPGDFPLLQQFKDYQSQGLLVNTDRVAEALLTLLAQRQNHLDVHYEF